MRFLKNKIALANKQDGSVQSNEEEQSTQGGWTESSVISSSETSQSKNTLANQMPHFYQKPKEIFIKPKVTTRDGSSSAKNIMKNYSRALVNFALSGLVEPYLAAELEKTKQTMTTFKRFIAQSKGKINCIKNLREILLVTSEDSKQMAELKRLFKLSCEVFLKYFCVNWVFESKVMDKIIHLKYRGKILRRIQHPELFTYLENFVS
jgi:hypothetical protein